jgi:hypothetical protein
MAVEPLTSTIHLKQPGLGDLLSTHDRRLPVAIETLQVLVAHDRIENPIGVGPLVGPA